jgi:hypothetical protein
MKSPSFSSRFFIIQYSLAASHSLFVSCLILLNKTIPSQFFLSKTPALKLLATALPFLVFTSAIYSILRLQNKSGVSDPIVNYIFSNPSRIKLSQFFAIATLSIGLLGVFLPSYHFEEYSAYYTRLQPLLVWAGVLGLQLLICILYPYRSEISKHFQKSRTENKIIIRSTALIFSVFIFLWFIIAQTGIGISTDEDFWYEAGVPILPAQILISALAGIWFGQFEKSKSVTTSRISDQWIFLGIWFVTALFWGLTPAPNTYMNPAPLPPNHEVYPYSDAAKYDMQSQSALIGQGLNQGKVVDNPLYPVFLIFIHLLSGQNYAINMALQAAIFAIFPSIAYLIGKFFLGRSLGITVASMIAFHGYNSIVAASIINLASPKQMMTDFPTGIGVALSILTLIKWINNGESNPAGAIWHGGTIGFTFLIRPTALSLLAVAPTIKFFQSFPNMRWIRYIILVLAGFIIFITPWGVRNALIKSDGGYGYLNKINLIINERFPETNDKRNEQELDNTEDWEQNNSRDRVIQSPAQRSQVLIIVLKHFTNNIIGSTLILPTSPFFDNLHNTVKSPDTFWVTFWNGELNSRQITTLVVSLVILAMGIAVLWEQNKLIALIPLAALILYQLTNSIGRTSGGRFLAPTEWIVLLYFSAGIIGIHKLLYLSLNIKAANFITETSSSYKSIFSALSLVLLLGSAPLLTELTTSLRNTASLSPLNKETPSISQDFQNILLASTNYSAEDIARFLDNRDSILLTGQAMYPRYFSYRAVTRYTEGGIKGVEFPHLEFYLLELEDTQKVVLYKLSSIPLENNTNVLVLGCKNKKSGYVDALVVFTGIPENIVHVRHTDPPLKCPLPQPVCDNNGNCD